MKHFGQRLIDIEQQLKKYMNEKLTKPAGKKYDFSKVNHLYLLLLLRRLHLHSPIHLLPLLELY